MNPQNQHPPDTGGFYIDQDAEDKMTAFKKLIFERSVGSTKQWSASIVPHTKKMLLLATINEYGFFQ